MAFRISPALRFAAFLSVCACTCAPAYADTLDDIASGACEYFSEFCDTGGVSVTTVVIVTVDTAPASAPLPGPFPAGNGQRDLMLEAATQHTMASALRMQKHAASALVEYALAEQLARRANLLGVGDMYYPSDHPKTELGSQFEALTGWTEADLYHYLSTLRGQHEKGLAGAQAAYAKLVGNFPAANAALFRGPLGAVKRSDVAAAIRQAAPAAPVAAPPPEAAPVEIAQGKVPESKPPPAAQEAPRAPPSAAEASRTPASLERGRRELEELWLFMSDTQSAGGELPGEVRAMTLFQRVKQRYRVWELRQHPADMPPPKL